MSRIKIIGIVICVLIGMGIIGNLIPDEENSSGTSTTIANSKISTVEGYDLRGVRLGMTIEEAAGAMYEDFVSSGRGNYYGGAIKSPQDMLNMFNDNLKEEELIPQIEQLGDENIREEQIAERLNISVELARRHMYGGKDVRWKEIMRRGDFFREGGNYLIRGGGDFGQYRYGDLDDINKDGFIVYFTNDEFGRKAYKAFLRILIKDVLLENVAEELIGKALTKYGNPTSERELRFDGGGLKAISLCWGECQWNEQDNAWARQKRLSYTVITPFPSGYVYLEAELRDPYFMEEMIRRVEEQNRTKGLNKAKL